MGIGAPFLFLQKIISNFGAKFAATLALTYICVKGFCYFLVSVAILPYYKNLGVTGIQYQQLTVLIWVPWSLKTSLGLFTDTVPVFGYHKRSYIVIASIIGTIALLTVGLVSFTKAMAPLTALLLLPVHGQIAMVDLLTEGKYAELMVKKPETGSSLVSYVWGLYGIGTILASFLVGPLADRIEPRILFLVALPMASATIVPAILGWFPEEKVENPRIRTDKLTAHPKLFRLAIAMTIGPIIVASCALGSPEAQSIVSSIVSIFLAVLGYIWLPDPLRKINLYLFIVNLVYVGLPGALDFFYTADEKCLPNGPHFSMTYYLTFANIVGCFAQFLGVIVFQRYLSLGTFRKSFLVASCIKILASLCDIILVKRYNLLVGISDKYFYIFGDAIILSGITMLELVVSLVLTSKLCPPGIEATIYALLASYQNLVSYKNRLSKRHATPRHP